MNGVEGFMYANGDRAPVERADRFVSLTSPGLVAGAFILASLVRIFRVKAIEPTYRLALLTALSFLLVAPLPLQLHLGHPEALRRDVLHAPQHSAMAMFGYVYLWYLMAVLVLEIWLRLPPRDRSPLAIEQRRPAAPCLQDHDPRLNQHQ